MKPLLLAWVIFVTTSKVLAAETIHLETFIKSYLSENEKINEAKLRSEIARQNLKISEDLYPLTVNITPEHTHRNQEFSSGSLEIYDRTTQLTSELTQGFAIGSEFSLKASKLLQKNDILTGRTESTLSLSYTQPLWKNSFGRLLSQKIERSKYIAESEEQNYISALTSHCSEGTKLYITSYIAQRRKETFEKILQTSDKVFKHIKSSYKNRLVKKIDFLSAKADHLNTESLVINSSNEFKNSLSSLSAFGRSIGEPNSYLGSSLGNPENVFSEVQTSNIDLDKNPELMSLENQLAANSLNRKIATEEAKTEGDLSVNVGENRGTALLSTGLSDVKDRFLSVSLSVEWPFFAKSEKAEIHKAKLEEKIILLRKRRRLRELRQSSDSLKTDLLRFAHLLKISKERITIYQDQILEARRLLRAGRMEIEDYLRLRDNYLNEELAYLDLLKKKWTSQMELTVAAHQAPRFCRL